MQLEEMKKKIAVKLFSGIEFELCCVFVVSFCVFPFCFVKVDGNFAHTLHLLFCIWFLFYSIYYYLLYLLFIFIVYIYASSVLE